MLNPYIEGWELRELLRKREIRPREAAEFFLARIEKLNPALGAFVTITPERALADADRLEKLSRSEADALPLFGVPYSIKDLSWTKGIRTTFGSKNYANFIPPADSEYVARLSRAGGILLGKTSTPEFGARPTTEGGFCPTAHNPWNLEHTAGRLQRRRCRRERRGARTAASGQRRRRLDSDSVGMLRRVRHQDLARAHHLRAGSRRRMGRMLDDGTDRAHRSRRRMDARCDGRACHRRRLLGASAREAVYRRGQRASEEVAPRDVMRDGLRRRRIQRLSRHSNRPVRRCVRWVIASNRSSSICRC